MDFNPENSFLQSRIFAFILLRAETKTEDRLSDFPNLDETQGSDFMFPLDLFPFLIKEKFKTLFIFVGYPAHHNTNPINVLFL